MSQKQTSSRVLAVSAFPPEPDLATRSAECQFGAALKSVTGVLEPGGFPTAERRGRHFTHLRPPLTHGTPVSYAESQLSLAGVLDTGSRRRHHCTAMQRCHG